MRNKTTRKPNVEEDDKAPLDNIIEINKNIKEISGLFILPEFYYR